MYLKIKKKLFSDNRSRAAISDVYEFIWGDITAQPVYIQVTGMKHQHNAMQRLRSHSMCQQLYLSLIHICPVRQGALQGRKFVFLFQGAAPEPWMLEKAEYTMRRFAQMYRCV